MDFQNLVPLLTLYGIQVLGAIAILVLGRIVSRILASITRKALERSQTDPGLTGFVTSLVGITVMAFAVIAALAKFGVQTASFVAVLGAAGLAVGLSLQGSLANFASGVMLLIFRPIRVHDLIEVGGYTGHVTDIDLFVTVINTLDNQRIIIPNSVLTSGVINNVNANGTRRVDLVIGISYSDDIEKAKTLAHQVMRSDSRVLSDPAPTVAVHELGDSSVNLVVRPWCKAEDYWDVWFSVTQQVKEAYDANAVTIPFPQRDVHMISQGAA